jgi:ABC-2 type transport system ATP-binding protein
VFSLIQLKSFTKYYNKVPAVIDVSFCVPDNGVTALVGLNGAGKTTILKAISAIHYADKGSVIVNGIDVVEFSEKVKDQCAFVTEQPRFYPTYTVCELLEIEIELKNHILSKKETYKRVRELVSQFSLQAVCSKKIKELSKGYRQRLSFACAFCGHPSVFLLDEPMTGLDPRQIIETRNLIKNLSKNKTVLFSTHNMHEVEEICTQAVILHQGTVVATGTPAEICLSTATKTFEDAFMKLTQYDESTGQHNE